MVMVYFALFAGIALVGMGVITLSNLLAFPRLHPSPASLVSGYTKNIDRRRSPYVSLLVPARDEATTIGHLVSDLLAQHGPDFELIVLDDHSCDGTAGVARAAAAGDPRLRIVPGAALPAGWTGKNWACQQLAATARGEWLIFVDADTRWAPGSLAAVLAEAESTHADLLTVWPTQITVTWGERLVVPLTSLVVLGYLPVLLTHHSPWPAFAAASGQCMAFRRAAYGALGGHAAVRGAVLEDVQLARRLKAMAFPDLRDGRSPRLCLRMADGNGLVACRMYTCWREVAAGFAKNIRAGYGGTPGLLLATLFHWCVFLGPWAWLALGWLWPALPVLRLPGDAVLGAAGWPLLPALLAGLGLAVRALTARIAHQRMVDALLLPVSVVLMTLIAGLSLWWHLRYGGPRWKGRIIRPPR